jgi:membrane dipeptidase
VHFLGRHAAVDTHAHPGRTFVRGGANLTWKVRLYARRGTFDGRTIEAMRAGQVAAACFCAVADLPTLDAGAGGLRSIWAFVPGEAYAAYRTQIANLQELVTEGQVGARAPYTCRPPPGEVRSMASRPASLSELTSNEGRR